MVIFMLWCLVKGNECHGTVIQQNWNRPKPFMSSLIDVLFVLLIWNTQVSFSTIISQPTPFLIISYTLSLTPLICFSLSHSPSLPLTPHSVFYQPPFYIIGNWFGWSASLNKCIWTNVIPHLGFAPNILQPLDGFTNPEYKLLCFLIAIFFTERRWH